MRFDPEAVSLVQVNGGIAVDDLDLDPGDPGFLEDTHRPIHQPPAMALAAVLLQDDQIIQLAGSGTRVAIDLAEADDLAFLLDHGDARFPPLQGFREKSERLPIRSERKDPPEMGRDAIVILRQILQTVQQPV